MLHAVSITKTNSELALCLLTLCFGLQNISETKGKGLKVERTNLTLNGGSKVKSEPTKNLGHFLEVVFTSQTSKTNNKGDTGIQSINDPI